MKMICPACKKKIVISSGNLNCKYCDYKIRKNDLLDMIADEENEGYSKKNVDIAGLLCLGLGCLGAHRFYLGKYITGTIMLGLTLSIFLIAQLNFITPFICYLLLFAWWGFDIVMATFNFFTDGDGKPLKQDPEPYDSKTHLTIGVTFLVATVLFILITLLPLNLSFYLNAIICFIISIVSLIKSFLRRKSE